MENFTAVVPEDKGGTGYGGKLKKQKITASIFSGGSDVSG